MVTGALAGFLSSQDFEGQYYGYAVDASEASGFPALEYGEGSVPAEAFPSLAALLDSFPDALESGNWGGWPARVERGSIGWGDSDRHPGGED